MSCSEHQRLDLYLIPLQFVGAGEFETENYAYYMEDIWTVTDQLNLTIGLRSDVATNFGKTGVAFVELDDQFQQPGYGDTYYTFNSDTQTYVFNPRGGNGRSPWVFTLNASASYSFNINDLEGRLIVDVFNLLDTRQSLNWRKPHQVIRISSMACLCNVKVRGKFVLVLI